VAALERRGVVLVDAHAADVGVTHVLLSMRGGPAAELGEVREGCGVVVVSIPQRQAAAVRERGRAEDGGPLGCRGVDAALGSLALAGVNQFLVPSLVLAVGASPVLRSLNVEPDAAGPLRLAVVVQVAHHLAHLSSSTLGAGRGCKRKCSIHSKVIKLS
jgi:hypothetical protein